MKRGVALTRSSLPPCLPLPVLQLEIYNESIIDLLRDSRALGPNEPRPHIRESTSRGIYVENVVITRATDAEQVGH